MQNHNIIQNWPCIKLIFRTYDIALQQPQHQVGRQWVDTLGDVCYMTFVHKDKMGIAIPTTRVATILKTTRAYIQNSKNKSLIHMLHSNMRFQALESRVASATIKRSITTQPTKLTFPGWHMLKAFQLTTPYEKTAGESQRSW